VEPFGVRCESGAEAEELEERREGLEEPGRLLHVLCDLSRIKNGEIMRRDKIRGSYLTLPWLLP